MNKQCRTTRLFEARGYIIAGQLHPRVRGCDNKILDI